MARIAGVDIPRHKKIEISLTYIYGLGRKSAINILDTLGINKNLRAQELNDEQINAIRKYIDTNHSVEGDLKRSVQSDIKRLLDLNCYRGIRHRKGLPTRGQRTKTNARTRKGPRKTVANKKKGYNRMNTNTKVILKKKRIKRNVPNGLVAISATFNNTIITLSDTNGDVLTWSSAGSKGFKGSRRSTPFAAQVAAEDAAKKAIEMGMESCSVMVAGPGSGRESAIRAISAAGIKVTQIKDTTPIPHNGCRPPKRRRV